MVLLMLYLGMISLCSSAGGECSTHRAVRRPATVPGAGDPRLDKGRLDILVRSYFVKGLGQSTNKVMCMLVASGDTSLSAPRQGCWQCLLRRTSCAGSSPRWPARA